MRGVRDFLIRDVRLILVGRDEVDRFDRLLRIEPHFDGGIAIMTVQDQLMDDPAAGLRRPRRLRALFRRRLVVLLQDQTPRDARAQPKDRAMGFLFQAGSIGLAGGVVFPQGGVDRGIGDPPWLGGPGQPLMVMAMGGGRDCFRRVGPGHLVTAHQDQDRRRGSRTGGHRQGLFC